MKKISILAGVALLALSGTAAAQPHAGERGDGALTRAEAAARAEQRFQSIDTNRDGQITREEMCTARQQRRAQRAERREQRLASLSQEQRARIAERRAQRRARIEAMTPEQRAERRAAQQARRGQHGGLLAAGGTVSLEQFRGWALARFERMDADRNGTVTREERRQARQQRQQRRAG